MESTLQINDVSDYTLENSVLEVTIRSTVSDEPDVWFNLTSV